MDQVYSLGIILAVLLIVYLAYSAYSGNRKRDIHQRGTADQPETMPQDTLDYAGVSEKNQDQIDSNLVYQKKAILLQKLLDTVKETEGLRETTLTEIKNLESQINSLKKAIDAGKFRYSLRESDVRMTYVSSRIDWIIKSYPRLRNDKNLLGVQGDIKKINERIKNLKEE